MNNTNNELERVKSLFKVDIEMSIYAWAENEAMACEVASRLEALSYVDFQDYAIASKVTSEREIDRDWKSSTPYGAPNNKTCSELLDVMYPKRWIIRKTDRYIAYVDRLSSSYRGPAASKLAAIDPTYNPETIYIDRDIAMHYCALLGEINPVGFTPVPYIGD